MNLKRKKAVRRKLGKDEESKEKVEKYKRHQKAAAGHFWRQSSKN